MRRLLFASFVTSLIVVAACGGDSDPPSSGGSSGGGETITGRERFGWSQAADVAGDLSFYKYALYVDGQRRVVEGESCSLNAAATAVECTAPLPALGAGRHTLALAAFFTVGDTVVEGVRSPVLDVTVAGATAPAGAPIVQGGPFESSDGLLLHADILARDLSDPIDIAVAPDSRVFVAERRGRIRMFSDNGEESAKRDDNLLDALRETIETDSAAVLSITLSPDFAASRVLHVAYATMARGEPVVRVVRAREVAGALGQTAVLLTYPVPSIDLPAVMRFGPDAQLYLAIGGGSARPDDPTTVAGRLQRLGADGTTPDDSPGGSPVMSAGHQAPRGLVWRPSDPAVWALDADDLYRIASAPVDATVPPAPSTPASPAPILRLDAGLESSGMTTVVSAESPFAGDLIVSTLGSRDLLRFQFNTDGQPQLTARLLQERFGRIAQVMNGPDGSIYFVTANTDEWGAGHDVLVRVRPRTRAAQKPPI